ncbi:MAG TPA: glycosyltransferase family 39 protein [Aromatoleum sp.]|uniref:ArnT family glycosyltransferase n=1 Tax=Aromatoleum sp. TaxID=2307007 RepID=UPI002B492AF9|nr:glycosyltransferase family 39 protein [Aromatoleum sp.]HJV24250.1 glycosyltransferase family 39 protein [Aromatoleum sp.]
MMPAAPESARPRPLLALCIVLLPLIAFFLRLGGAPLFDVDEGAFSEATREMFERGDFLSTYLNGEHRFDKPILIYWLQAIGYLIFGPTEWGFRFPSALAAASWSYATWYFARQRFGANTALAALAIVSTAIGPFAIGRAATADALLNLLLALALFDAWRNLESGRRAPLLRAFVWIGLGALTKGPIALLIPGAVSFLYCASRGEFKRWARAVFDPVGLAIFAIIVVPWYATALAIHGKLFIDGFIMKHNVERFTGTLEGHAGSLFYYVIAVPLLLLPWTGPLIASLRHVRSDIDTGVRRFLWIWAVFVVAFFSVSGTKLPHYVLYGSTPLFLLIAIHRNELRRTWLHLIAPLLLLGLLPLLPTIFAALSASNAGNAYYRAMLSEAMGSVTAEYYIVTIGGLLLWLTIAMRWQAAAWMKLGAAAAIQIVVLAGVVVPWAGGVLQGPVREAGLIAHTLGEPVFAWRYYAPSFSVYRQAVTLDKAPAPGEVALTRVDRLPASGVDILYRKGGVALVRKLPE